MKNIKRNLLRVALGILGLNVFTACYGIPPGEYIPLSEEEETEMAAVAEDTEEPQADESTVEDSHEL